MPNHKKRDLQITGGEETDAVKVGLFGWALLLDIEGYGLGIDDLRAAQGL